MQQNYCAGYCRCSTNMQDRSISDQVKEIERFAQKNYLKIVTWFLDEDRSGTSIDQREGFQKMKTLVEEGRNEFSIILVYDTSRWGRFPDPRESIYWEIYFEKRGVDIIYTNDDVQNTKSFQSAIIKAVKHAAAGDYSRRLSILITRAFISRAKEGFWNGGAPPYGYKRAEIDKQKKIVRILGHRERYYNPKHKIILVLGDEKEIETVRKIFYYFVHKDMDLRMIAQKFNNEGSPSPSYKWIQTSKPWHKGIFAPDKPGKWSYCSAFKILKNELYTGKMIWGVKKRGIFSTSENLWGDKEGRKTRHDGQNVVVCQNAHPPIISEKLFRRAQEMVKSGSKSKRVRKTYSYSPYLLSGIIECGACGFRFSCGYFGEKSYKNLPQRLRHYFYRDAGSTLRGRRVCSSYYIKMESLDKLILNKIKRRITSCNSIVKITRRLRSALIPITITKSYLEQLKKRITRTEDEIEEIQRLAKRGQSALEADRLLTNLMEKNEGLLDVKRKVESARRLIPTLSSVAKVIKDYYNYCSNVLENSTPQEKKVIVRNMIDKIVIDKNNNSGRIYFCKVPKNIDLYLELLCMDLNTTVTCTIRLPRRQREA